MAARLAPIRASAIGADTSGHSVSTAHKAGGVRPDDLITTVNREPVSTAAEAIRELNRVESGRLAFLLILRGNSQALLRVRKE